MAHLVVSIKLSIDAIENEEKLLELINNSMCEACTYIENNTSHDYIQYRITDVMEIPE